VRTDGSGLRRVTNLPGGQDWGSWSPDGKEIVFSWMTPFGQALYLIDPDGTHLRRLSTAAVGSLDSAWSPDSRYLASIQGSGAPGGWRLVVIDAKTGRFATVATVPEYADNPTWSSR